MTSGGAGVRQSHEGQLAAVLRAVHSRQWAMQQAVALKAAGVPGEVTALAQAILDWTVPVVSKIGRPE